MNYGPKKPFKKWFESLNIQNIEQLNNIFDQIPSELVLACTTSSGYGTRINRAACGS